MTPPPSDGGLKSPVAFIVFNRPDRARAVLQSLEAVRPRTLYVVADGPRPGNAKDAEAVPQVRALFDRIPWPCEVHRLFADENLGIVGRHGSALDRIFEAEDEVIAIEDDTLIDPSYFTFAQEMLERYRHDRRVTTVQAFCGAPHLENRASYLFSRTHHPWGRAWWKRSWVQTDVAMRQWDRVKAEDTLRAVWPDKAQRAYWTRMLDRTYARQYDSLSYRYNLSCWLQSGLSIVPATNLVRNTGVGGTATHTLVDDGQGRVPVEPLSFPLRHPDFVLPDWRYDDYIMKRFHARVPLWKRVQRKLSRVLKGRG